jgi:hypothetical protein
MQIEERIQKMKQSYEGIAPPDILDLTGWDEVAMRLDEQDTPKSYTVYWRVLAFACVMLFITAGTVLAAQSSKPGDVLYPVKQASEKVTKQVNTIIKPISVDSTIIKKSDQNKQNSSTIATPTPSPVTITSTPKTDVKQDIKQDQQNSTKGSSSAPGQQKKEVKGVTDSVVTPKPSSGKENPSTENKQQNEIKHEEKKQEQEAKQEQSQDSGKPGNSEHAQDKGKAGR